jgi:hypothetical protein
VDLIAALLAGGGVVADKPEGLAVSGRGRLFAAVDNDGLEDAPGESVLLRLGHARSLTAPPHQRRSASRAATSWPRPAGPCRGHERHADDGGVEHDRGQAGERRRRRVGPVTLIRTPPARGEYPFKLGVASGNPAANGVVLWTRLVPELFEPGGGMPSRRVTLGWQVASDERFRHAGSRPAAATARPRPRRAARGPARPGALVDAVRPLQERRRPPGRGELLWHDAWDGFPAARNRLTAAWVEHQVVATVSRPDAPEPTFASFVVEHGRPGAPRVA